MYGTWARQSTEQVLSKEILGRNSFDEGSCGIVSDEKVNHLE